uniref:Putative secreted protein n=1 Tax=Anopheles triannulatus TaxID=58253 RepID=A0A2M4B772_9DIPT
MCFPPFFCRTLSVVLFGESLLRYGRTVWYGGGVVGICTVGMPCDGVLTELYPNAKQPDYHSQHRIYIDHRERERKRDRESVAKISLASVKARE